jgi:predicted peptidase
MTITRTIAICGTLFMAHMAQAADIKIEPGKQLPQSVSVHVGEGDAAQDVTIRYLLFTPKNYKADGDKLPLMLFLHGYGECSNDKLDLVKIHGPAKIVETKPDFPFIVVSPQCPPPLGDDAKSGKRTPGDAMNLIRQAWKPEELIKLIDHVSGELNVDKERIYVTGLSMGGYGTWRMAATYPDRIAAAIPICGGGEPDKWAKALAGVPIWAFHGDKDSIVPVTESRHMVYALKQIGGDVKITIYPGVEHNSWEQTYNNQEVYDWLLSQRRKAK